MPLQKKGEKEAFPWPLILLFLVWVWWEWMLYHVIHEFSSRSFTGFFE